MSIKFESMEILERELEGISHLKRVAFTESCCERLLPNCYLFTIEEGQVDPNLYLKITATGLPKKLNSTRKQ
ncbi:MAG: hypothetical protein WBA93_19885 [Microcoleaceae cyanobacterium]